MLSDFARVSSVFSVPLILREAPHAPATVPAHVVEVWYTYGRPATGEAHVVDQPQLLPATCGGARGPAAPPPGLLDRQQATGNNGGIRQLEVVSSSPPQQSTPTLE